MKCMKETGKLKNITMRSILHARFYFYLLVRLKDNPKLSCGILRDDYFACIHHPKEKQRKETVLFEVKRGSRSAILNYISFRQLNDCIVILKAWRQKEEGTSSGHRPHGKESGSH